MIPMPVNFPVPMNFDAIQLRNGPNGLQIGFAAKGVVMLWLDLASKLADDITIEMQVAGVLDLALVDTIGPGKIQIRPPTS